MSDVATRVSGTLDWVALAPGSVAHGRVLIRRGRPYGARRAAAHAEARAVASAQRVGLTADRLAQHSGQGDPPAPSLGLEYGEILGIGGQRRAPYGHAPDAKP